MKNWQRYMMRVAGTSTMTEAWRKWTHFRNKRDEWVPRWALKKGAERLRVNLVPVVTEDIPKGYVAAPRRLMMADVLWRVRWRI